MWFEGGETFYIELRDGREYRLLIKFLKRSSLEGFPTTTERKLEKEQIEGAPDFSNYMVFITAGYFCLGEFNKNRYRYYLTVEELLVKKGLGLSGELLEVIL